MAIYKDIDRPEYLAKLERHRVATDRIKMVTGVRRSGKSTLFRLFQNKLRAEGITEDQILNIDLEDFANMELRDGAKLHKFVEDHVAKNKLTYVFIDEVQFVPNYVDVIVSLRKLNNIDLYVTGSNTSLLKGNLPKKLVGRTQQIHIFPLSFKEYVSRYISVSGTPGGLLDAQFQDYITYGSFPGVLVYREPQIKQGGVVEEWDIKGAKEYLAGTYDDILVRDILEQEDVKELPELTRVINFMFSNIGSATSINNIFGVINNDLKLKADDKKLYAPAIEKYLNALVNSFLFYKADVEHIGKELLRTNAKYYAVDVGMRYNVLGGTTAQDAGHMLENIVYLELLRRGYDVKVGKVGDKEIDFIAQAPDGHTEYYQVAQSVIGEETLVRELAPLEALKDNYPKFLLTRDLGRDNYNGIQRLNALEWLLA
jgi:predicted AAA+ superfamily ATPase